MSYVIRYSRSAAEAGIYEGVVWGRRVVQRIAVRLQEPAKMKELLTRLITGHHFTHI